MLGRDGHEALYSQCPLAPVPEPEPRQVYHRRSMLDALKEDTDPDIEFNIRGDEPQPKQEQKPKRPGKKRRQRPIKPDALDLFDV